MVLQYGQDVGQITERIQVIRLCCFRYAVDDRTRFRAIYTIRAAKEDKTNYVICELSRCLECLVQLVLGDCFFGGGEGT